MGGSPTEPPGNQRDCRKAADGWKSGSNWFWSVLRRADMVLGNELVKALDTRYGLGDEVVEARGALHGAHERNVGLSRKIIEFGIIHVHVFHEGTHCTIAPANPAVRVRPRDVPLRLGRCFSRICTQF
jgi:hypothetical protein